MPPKDRILGESQVEIVETPYIENEEEKQTYDIPIQKDVIADEDELDEIEELSDSVFTNDSGNSVEILQPPVATVSPGINKNINVNNNNMRSYTKTQTIELLKQANVTANKLDNEAAQKATNEGKKWNNLNRRQKTPYRKEILDLNEPFTETINALNFLVSKYKLTTTFGDKYDKFINPGTSLIDRFLIIRDLQNIS